ncbi:uncharacterized protein LOC141835635 [Curcuma longa]|uniref:uncharacterized protein LOC141835635 n=1 Tax=Curcuma longa TaxID=136217 RepID=UPI003D9E4F15
MDSPGNGECPICTQDKVTSLERLFEDAQQKEFLSHFRTCTKSKGGVDAVQQGILDGGPAPLEYSSIRKQANLLAEGERQFYQQRAKNVYLRSADKCTKFFHDVVKQNNKRNAIITLLKWNGDQTESIEEVGEECVDYFHGLFGHVGEDSSLGDMDSIGRTLLRSQTEELCKPVEVEEIQVALHDIRSGKASRPDGYGLKFFLSAWDIVGNDLVAAVQEFFQSGKLLKQ